MPAKLTSQDYHRPQPDAADLNEWERKALELAEERSQLG